MNPILKGNRANSPPPAFDDEEVESTHFGHESKEERKVKDDQPVSPHEIKLYGDLYDKHKHASQPFGPTKVMIGNR